MFGGFIYLTVGMYCILILKFKQYIWKYIFTIEFLPIYKLNKELFPQSRNLCVHIEIPELLCKRNYLNKGYRAKSRDRSWR